MQYSSIVTEDGFWLDHNIFTNDSDRSLGIPPLKDKKLLEAQKETEIMKLKSELKSLEYKKFLDDLMKGRV